MTAKNKGILQWVGIIVTLTVIAGGTVYGYGALGARVNAVEEESKHHVRTERFEDVGKRLDRLESKIDRLLSRGHDDHE